jgi:ABC-type transport system involved in cytochrome c biogenesis ATPase subunit
MTRRSDGVKELEAIIRKINNNVGADYVRMHIEKGGMIVVTVHFAGGGGNKTMLAIDRNHMEELLNAFRMGMEFKRWTG